MGLYKDGSEGKGPDPENDPEKLEKDYEKMYMKIGRDFLHKEDFVMIMEDFISRLQAAFPLLYATFSEQSVPLRNNTNALMQALIYKEYIEEEKDGVEAFAPLDLAKIEEDDEEEEEE